MSVDAGRSNGVYYLIGEVARCSNIAYLESFKSKGQESQGPIRSTSSWLNR